MIFGIPQEIRLHEGRVGAVPFVVEELTRRGHKVFVETNAGLDSLVADEVYEKSGATIVPSSEKLYAQSEVILKVREPMPVEYELIQPEHKIFAFFHFINNLEMARSIMARGCTCFAYEMLTASDGSRPMMIMNGQIAGRMAVQQGMYFLEKNNGGRGKLLGGITGSPPARVAIIGAGAVGFNAAMTAGALGAEVFLLDSDYQRLQSVSGILPPNVTTLISHEQNFREIFPTIDLLITAIHVPNNKPPVIIPREFVKLLPKGSVIVDVDIDRGGCVETSKATNHDSPTFEVDGIVHYCVPNLAGVVPATASQALSSAFLPYLLKIAEAGFLEALKADVELRSGLAIFEGRIANETLAKTLSVPLYQFQEEVTNSGSKK